MDFKSHIKTHRGRLGWSRRRLSLAIGMQDSYIGKVEDGLIDPSLSALRAMARIFRQHGHPFSEALEQLLGVAPEREPERAAVA